MAILLDAPLVTTINGFDAAQANGQSIALSGGEIAPIPGRLEITTAPDGSSALMSRINPTDTLTYGGIRSEIDYVPEANAERWYVWDVYFPTDLIPDTALSFMQIHDSPDDGESPVKFPNFEFMLLGGDVYCMVPLSAPSEATATGRRPRGTSIGAVRGRWATCAIHTNWATDTSGFLRVFYDGRLLVKEWFRACGYADAVGPYIKLGLYDFPHVGISRSYEAFYRNVKVYGTGYSVRDVLGFQPAPMRSSQLIF